MAKKTMLKDIIDTISKEESVYIYLIDEDSYSENEDPAGYAVTGDIEFYIRCDAVELIKNHLKSFLNLPIIYTGVDGENNLCIALLGASKKK